MQDSNRKTFWARPEMKLFILLLAILANMEQSWVAAQTPAPVPVPACVSNPSDPSCVNYVYPNPQGVVNRMCAMMGNMPTCSVQNNVCNNQQFSSSPYCIPRSLMADVCTDMVMGEQGCKDFRSMCWLNSTVIAECFIPTLVKVIPTTMQAQSFVNDICNAMPMAGCSTCQGNPSGCDLLSTYSDLCLAMPEMSQCGTWKTMCETIPDWPYCARTAIPEMRMYFHTGILDYVLFKGWVPQNTGQYVATWFAIFVAGVLLEGIKFIRAYCEKKWLPEYQVVDSGSTKVTPFAADAASWSWKIDIPRSLLATLELAWGYLLMLVAMTFNVGLFFAVLAGCLIGTLLFGRFLAVFPKAKTASCH